ncbi:hypothetical protein BBK36DRAFT_1121708 [Trichoderma citrinoviride]|uniref:Bacteriophage T5 Orf172 DNA-binding domain-containing protein n=1 Tax=Trichoderma citrinoviride TaxID=58853 RepID=A0A2T4B7K9_9HYPO|nr:hypothetical protein BBK36DRAFT_1121708 [Trichoderma citrinoviride]PTB65201.1 hypothetical protein BBK36DRAFT_1121708 [Trichoderma citrinoviride]
MPPRTIRQNPVFKELTEIQRYTDVCPNPQDSDFTTCRAKRRDGGRCRNPPCTQYERWQIPSLLSEFRDMTECPDTDSFYNKMETFVTYTHCKRWHRPVACQAFSEWKRERIANRRSVRQRPARVARPRPAPAVIQPINAPVVVPVIQPITAAALQMLPSTPRVHVPSSASATSDDGSSSFNESVAETRSLASNTTFMSSPHHTPLRNGTVSAFEIQDIVEEVTVVEETVPETRTVGQNRLRYEVVAVEQAPLVQAGSSQPSVTVRMPVQDEAPRQNTPQDDDQRVQDSALTLGMHDALPQEDSGTGEDAFVKALGITGLHRNGSVRDHSPVFQIINSHPTSEKMKEGVVYILEHNENPSLFKIGWSSKSAEERLHQPNNCYGTNTRVIYETKRFAGAPHAERISQIILRHANIRVLECSQCRGGHREWFAANRDTVRETVTSVEEFVQMPAYTLQNGEYKLSPEAYDRVVKQMCDFSVLRLGELMRGPREAVDEEPSTVSPGMSTAAIFIPPPQICESPTEMTGYDSDVHQSEIQQVDESSISPSLHSTKPQKELSAGTKLARKMKRLFAAGDSAKRYFLRPREPKTQTSDGSKRAFGSAIVDLKGKAREAGTKARQEAREFRRDFKEELRRKSEE